MESEAQPSYSFSKATELSCEISTHTHFGSDWPGVNSFLGTPIQFLETPPLKKKIYFLINIILSYKII